MSLIGYLNSSGIDLSYVFHNVNNSTFNNAIATEGGIYGPPNITYGSTMIGYITHVPVTITNKAISTATYYSLVSFTLNPGSYLFVAYSYNEYTSSGALTAFLLGISSVNNATSSDGIVLNIRSAMNLPASTYRFIIAPTFFPLTVTTSKTYYFIQRLDFTGVTVKNNIASGQCYLRYVRIA